MMPGEGVTVGVIRPDQPAVRHGDTAAQLSNTALAQLPIHHELVDVLVDWSGTVGSDEKNDRRETVVSDVVLLCHPGVDVKATDFFKLPDGDVYHVVGKPSPWAYGLGAGVAVKGKAVIG